MKYFLSLILVYLTLIQSAFAATAQVNNVFQMMGRLDGTSNILSNIPINGLSQVQVLVANQPSTYATANYLGFYSHSSPAAGNTQYQVPAGKTFVALMITLAGSTASLSNIVQFGYGTAALASNNTATAPTGNQMYGPGSTPVGGSGPHMMSSIGGGGYPTSYTYPISFPANSYPWVRIDNAGATTQDLTMIGVEI